MKNITLKDIADRLGLSPNTISKALSGGHVPERTREIVVAAAIDMGYKTYANAYAAGQSHFRRRVVLLSAYPLSVNSFFVHLLRGIEASVSEYNIELVQWTTNGFDNIDEQFEKLKKTNPDGLLCIEFLDEINIKKILLLGIPTVFFDFANDCNQTINGCYDIVMMENYQAVRNACLYLIREKHCRSFGFVGDIFHCKGFYERFLGMREAMFIEGIPYNESFSITKSDKPWVFNNAKNVKALAVKLNDMPALPDVFVCANDGVAIPFITLLKKRGLKIPDHVAVLGFDDINEGKYFNPPLTTLIANKQTIGKTMVSILHNRIRNPKYVPQTVYVQSVFVERGTT